MPLIFTKNSLIPITNKKQFARYKLMVNDDHKLFRDGLVTTLRLIQSVAYVTQVANGEEVIKLFLLKNTDKEEIAQAMVAVMSGKQFYSKDISGSFLAVALDPEKSNNGAGTTTPLFP